MEKSKKISNDQELIQSDPISCPQNLSVSICRMGESGLVIRLAHAQCSVITEDGEQGFSKTGPYF